MTEPKRPRSELPLVQLLPNLLTVTALCAGLTAIRFAAQGRFGFAIGLILLAAVLDGLDGRLARMLKQESQIGAELDSLGDFVNFGVAPALTLYFWAFQGWSSAGWIAVLIYAVCCVMRLARFNVDSRVPHDPTAKTHFVGVPSPAGAMLVMLPMYVVFMLDGMPHLPPSLVAIWMVAIGALMISRVPTPSFKGTTFYADTASYIVLGFVALVAALLTYTWTTLVVLDVAYLAALGFAVRQYRVGRSGEEE
ncbi:CDP-diacylglycerol--serine O-phosphatidyltransferase [Rhodobacter ferrooxidans]|uniref:CDP-diacylglycerol--serine O-phosphatidyltransferase n=1 Tax=Rhodobacter ferrooxidans TaxID=371731 RepID=C8S0A7_9RHOB|nr:CDP-diacylglycerol--serine O-phosphatidyltransferase [Rhodobacter sp. SW2]EEW25716.1 CDP-diacylglycerol/serine O-phosphatidyltransferase [Rhodobacter sp. SW2]